MPFAFISLLKKTILILFLREKKFSFFGLKRNPVLSQITTMGFKIQIGLNLGFLSLFLEWI
jgi:hypothetical protein